MTTRRFIAVAAIGLALAAACLGVGDARDSSVLSIVGIALIGAVFAARAMWTWRGRGHEWLAWTGMLAAVIALAALVSLLSG